MTDEDALEREPLACMFCGAMPGDLCSGGMPYIGPFVQRLVPVRGTSHKLRGAVCDVCLAFREQEYKSTFRETKYETWFTWFRNDHLQIAHVTTRTCRGSDCTEIIPIDKQVCDRCWVSRTAYFSSYLFLLGGIIGYLLGS